MTENAAVYRPSPRPRPAGAPQRPSEAPTLRIVPAPDLQPETATTPDAPSEIVSAGHSGAWVATKTAIARSGAQMRTLIDATSTYWTPPAVFTDRPASLQELAVYARTAPWTAEQAGPIRTAGVWYYRTVAYPYTVVSRYREWFVQRPLRLAALLGMVKLTANTGPGIWVVDHLVYPAAQLAGHLFL